MNLQLQQTAAGPGQNSNAEVGTMCSYPSAVSEQGCTQCGKGTGRIVLSCRATTWLGSRRGAGTSVRTVMNGYTSFHPPDKSPNLG